MGGKPRHHPFFFLPISQEETIWHPRTDIYKTRNGWLLKYELAGVTSDDVAICVSGRQITVSGTRRDCVVDEGCSHYSMEISYNRFERTIDLPFDASRARIHTEFKDGILLVSIETEEPR